MAFVPSFRKGSAGRQIESTRLEPRLPPSLFRLDSQSGETAFGTYVRPCWPLMESSVTPNLREQPGPKAWDPIDLHHVFVIKNYVTFFLQRNSEASPANVEKARCTADSTLLKYRWPKFSPGRNIFFSRSAFAFLCNSSSNV